MHAFTIMTGLVAAASAAAIERSPTYVAPQGDGEFKLQVIAIDGRVSKYSGMFLAATHAGAGLNALVGTFDQASGASFKFDSAKGDIYNNIGDNPYYFSLGDTKLDKPKGYYGTGFNVGDSDNHFQFSGADNLLQFDPKHANFVWAMCDVVVYAGGPEPALVFRDPKTTPDYTCAKVHVKAIF